MILFRFMNEVYDEFAIFNKRCLNVVIAIKFENFTRYEYMFFCFVKEYLNCALNNSKDNIGFRMIMFFYLFPCFATFFYDYVVRALE